MSKRISKVDNIKYALSGNDRYIASVDPGETFVVECAINANDGTIRHLGQQLTEADVTFPFVNGATGPIEVRGSKAGDMLKVEIVNMELDKLGFTALWPGIGMFPDWVRRKEFGIQTRVVEVKDGRVHWNDHLKLPVRPMIGVLGWRRFTARADRRQRPTGQSRRQEITTGNTVMFRVNKDGTHLFMGDCHAIQGDGECNGMGAIEIAATLTVKVSLEKAPPRLNHPRIETATHICTLGCARPLEDAMRIAFEEMVYWMEDEWKIPAAEGYMLLGQIAEARCTQVVNPKYTYICKVDKGVLASYFG
jgi:acetamidase/formamidase